MKEIMTDDQDSTVDLDLLAIFGAGTRYRAHEHTLCWERASSGWMGSACRSQKRLWKVTSHFLATHTHTLKKTSETKSSLGQLVTHRIESQQVGRSDSLCSSSHSVWVCAFVCLCASTPLKGSLIESIQFPRPRWVLATQQAAGTEQGQTISTEAVWRYTTDSWQDSLGDCPPSSRTPRWEKQRVDGRCTCTPPTPAGIGSISVRATAFFSSISFFAARGCGESLM